VGADGGGGTILIDPARGLRKVGKDDGGAHR
jgi:hypothetical protein